MPKVIDKEAKKKEIIFAALSVFASKGVVKTKMIDIAEAAGIGKGTIYEYFRSKEEIFAAGFVLFFEDMEKMIEKALEGTDDPEQQLQLLMDTSLDSLNQYGPDFAAIMMDFWAEGIRNKDEEFLTAINMPRIYEEYRRLVRGILENGIKKGVFKSCNTLQTSAALIGAFDGIMLQWIMDRDMIDIEAAYASLLEHFLNGIKK